MPLVNKYLPKKISDIIGQENAPVLHKAVKCWKKGSKPVFIYGPSGCGKTSSIVALAAELGLELYEINASDTRNKEEIHQRVGSVLNQQSLFGNSKLVLIDEVDGLSGTEDRGGIQAITDLVSGSVYPVILTASNPWDTKFSTLRKKCVMLEFSLLSPGSIYEILKKICDKEKIKYDEIVLKSLARRSSGDARSAINDLQSLTIEAKELTPESLERLSERNKEDTIITALLKIFKSTDIMVASAAFDNVRESLDEQLLWLDENLPKEYVNPLDLERAYDKLSKADVFNRRIRRWQHWRFLVYINLLITAGIAVSKDAKYPGAVTYSPTGKLLKIWLANQKAMKKKSIAAKIAVNSHCSQKYALNSMLPYMKVAFQNNISFRQEFSADLDLSPEEIEWMLK